MPELSGEIRNEKGQFVKGVTGNPEGRPKGTFSLVEMIKHKLQEIPEGKDKTYAAYFIESLIKKAVIEGDVTMMRDIINRVDGLPKQTIAGDPNNPVGIVVELSESVAKKNDIAQQ